MVKDAAKQAVKGEDGQFISYTAYSTEIVLSNSSKLLVVGTRPAGAPEMAPKTNGTVAPEIAAQANGEAKPAVVEDIPF